jgi:5-methyltetrahydrofolate--homocysteine methyltransferase
MNQILNEISLALQGGNAKSVKELVEKAIEEKISAQDILEQGLLSGMDVVATKFKANDMFVPEVLLSARAMNAGSALLKPLLAEGGVKAAGKAIIGTVKGDLHDIGKNLVTMMFEGKGLEVIDLGVDVPPERFVSVYEEEKPDIVAISALLTTTMGEMKNTVEALNAAGAKTAIMVGGAPVTEQFGQSIGADYYADDAAGAAELAKSVILAKK